MFPSAELLLVCFFARLNNIHGSAPGLPLPEYFLLAFCFKRISRRLLNSSMTFVAFTVWPFLGSAESYSVGSLIRCASEYVVCEYTEFPANLHTFAFRLLLQKYAFRRMLPLTFLLKLRLLGKHHSWIMLFFL